MALKADDVEEEVGVIAEEELPRKRLDVRAVEDEVDDEEPFVVPEVELPSSRLFRVAIGHPEALKMFQWKRCNFCINLTYLRCERNFPVECPEPSQPGIGHLK